MNNKEFQKFKDIVEAINSLFKLRKLLIDHYYDEFGCDFSTSGPSFLGDILKPIDDSIHNLSAQKSTIVKITSKKGNFYGW